MSIPISQTKITCHHYSASLPMGWAFVGLTRVFRWAGPGSLGRAHSIASLGRAGPEGARPGSPNEPNECFTLIFSF